LSGLGVPIDQKLRTADEVIRELASAAHGVVSRRELLDAGVTPEQLRNRLGKGVLTRVHRGVYRAGHLAPSLEADYLAAVKACGDGTLVAGRAAAYLWGLIKGAPPKPELLTGHDCGVNGVTARRARRMELTDIGMLRGIPVITVPRTLIDLASSLPESALARACHEAGVRYGTTPRDVEECLARLPNASGRRKLRRVLHGDVPVSLSRLESRFVARLRKAGLPLPLTNKGAGGRRLDCRWPEHGLTVELDSYRYHRSRHAWEQDRLREREARARGDEFRRYTWRDVVEHPRFMLSELRDLLG
jgi:Transcriptional regulator, AbiEi antitoxin